jgi:hypothetical protein
MRIYFLKIKNKGVVQELHLIGVSVTPTINGV